LRRVLLSSLDGAAITSIRIGDVLHEFSDIPGVREDVIQVTLQIKQIRLKLDGVDSTRMNLQVRGEGTVTAADIVAPSEIEIVNPELYLFNVDSPRRSWILNSRSNAGAVIRPPVNAVSICPLASFPWMPSSARSSASIGK